MSTRWRAGLAAALACTGAAWAATEARTDPRAEARTDARHDTLSPTELTWLRAAAPVLAYARAEKLPLHVLVQPQDTPGQTPIGMAFIEGRCVLVLSMRGNPEAQATLDRMPPGLQGPVVEAIAAHELGHCWRHLRQTWGTLPTGMADLSGFSRVTPEQAELLQDMWRTRREEGFADLVGLAWTLQQHPQHYAAVHAWHVRERAVQLVDTGPHDTRVWLRLAHDPAGFGRAGSLFDRVDALWQAGLVAGF